MLTKGYGTWEFQLAYAMALLEHFSPAQVAEIVGVSVSTIHRWKRETR